LPLPVDYDTSARDARIDTLVQRLDAGPTTQVALGDFNLADREPRYQELTSRLRDAQREAGWGFGFTFPAEIGRRELSIIPSLVRIDYVFYDPSLGARSAEVGRMPGSDHYYLLTDLVLPER
jgi:vancomycin resistance protein VanJ